MLRKMLAAPAITMLAIVATAYAASADAISDGFSSAQSGITNVISTYAIPLVVAVLLVGLGVGLLIKYVRKGVRAA